MKTSRNLWPVGIVVTFALFFAGTVGLVVMACSQKVDLVSTDYYEQELKFQGRIDRVERTRHAAGHAAIAYDAASRSITVSLPPEQSRLTVLGSIELYRPSASGMDLAVRFAPDATGTQRLDASGLAPGLWRVRVSWTAEKENYYFEQKVVVGSKPS